MNSNMTLLSNYQCCSGFNIDLLIKFAEDIGFTYELVRVPDSKWGAYTEHKWNGLIGELTNRRVDVALASLMINSEREAVVDFSVPFMDSGIAIMTSKRTGIISPTAFLEPFDASLWFLVCVVGIQVYSLFIFFFEWLSPLGFDMKVRRVLWRNSMSVNESQNIFESFFFIIFFLSSHARRNTRRPGRASVSSGLAGWCGPDYSRLRCTLTHHVGSRPSSSCMSGPCSLWCFSPPTPPIWPCS